MPAFYTWCKQFQKQCQKSKVLFLLCAMLLGLLFSCNSYLADGMRVAWGKQLFQQGKYQEALLYFLAAEANQSRKSEASPSSIYRIRYNIGLVYSALGQTEAALQEWQLVLDAEQAEDKELRFLLRYNSGLLYSQRGSYTAARTLLVEALGLRPEHEQAKLALEDVLNRLKQKPQNQFSNAQVPNTASVYAGVNEEQILNYLAGRTHYSFPQDEAREPAQNDW